MKRLGIYLSVTFGLTWGLLIPAGIATGAFEHGLAAEPVMMALLGVSMFFPAVGALVAQFASNPHERIDLCYKPHMRENIRHYLAAWLLPAPLALAGCALFFVFNPQMFDPTATSYLQTAASTAGVSVELLTSTMPDLPLLVAGLLASSIFAAFINMIPAFGEELGWRGFLLPSLCERMSNRTAVLVSGIIWGVWHAPAIAMGHNYGMDYPGFPVVGFLVMTLACIALGSFMGYLRLKSNSVWPCALAHGAVNAVANLGVMFSTVAQSIQGPNVLGLVACIPFFMLGVACWLRMPESDAAEARR